MTFPETLLPLQVEISLDGTTWTDVSPDVRYEDKIRITRGRANWGQQVDPGRCAFALSNADGKYTPSNPISPYFGRIGRNTPVRVSVNIGSVALDLPGRAGAYASTPDAAPLDITGDLDIRIDATLDNWILPDYPSSGQTTFPRTELIGKFAANQRSYALSIIASRPYLEWSADGSSSGGAWCDTPLPLSTSGRLALRATLDVDNGAGGWTAVFYTADTITGQWAQLGSPVTGSGVTSIFSGTSSLKIGDAQHLAYNPALGRVHAAQVRSGIDGTIVANPDFTAQPSGTTSFVDSAGCTWTLAGGAEITNRKTRFVGEVAAWRPRSEAGGHDVVTEVEAAGVLRRLGIGAVPVKSPFYREFTSAGRVAAGVVAYWPMEDGAGAASLASAVSGHPPISMTAGVTPGAYGDWVASDPVPTLTSGSMRVTVPAYTPDSSSTSVVGLFVAVPEGGVVSTQRLLSLTQTGTARVWSLWLNTAGHIALRAYDADGVQVHDSGFSTDSINGRQKYLWMSLRASGPDVAYTISAFDIADSMATAIPDNTSSSFQITGTLPAHTTGRVTQLRLGEDAGMAGTAVGHLVVGSATAVSSAAAGVLVGWYAEEASSRVARLGTEERLHAYPTGPGDERCGVQPRGTALDIMRAAAEVDEGVLGELRSVLGLRYVTRASMYNQPAALVLDYAGNDGLVAPLEPTDDDQGVTNDVTVARTGGSSARVTLPTGALSTQPPPAGVGLYDTSYTLGLLDDSQPLQHAGWRLHLGTWDETRFPQVTINLAAAPHMIEAAAAVDTGSRLQITHPPVWLPPDMIDLLAQGYTEILDQFTWTLTFNCTPARAFDVAWVGGASTAKAAREFMWLDTDGSRLAGDLDASETAVDVYTTTGPRWTPNVADTPLDWRAGGEVMTVTAPGALLNTNPFFDTDITGWTGESATIAWSQTYVHPHPRAVGSLYVTPDGAAVTGGAAAAMTATDSITPNAQYKISMWVYSVNGWSDLRPSVHWYTGAGTFISTAGSAQPAVPAGVWTYLEETVTAPATARRARVRVRHGGTPSAADGYVVWAVRITRATSSWLVDSFSRSSASGWGVADTGQAWVDSGGAAADYTTSGAYGAHVLSTTSVVRRSGVAAPSPDFDVYCNITTSALATGDFLYGAVTARMQDASNMYMARLAFSTTNTISLNVRKVVAGVQTQLGSTYTLPVTHTAGTYIRVRFQGSGSTLRAKAWPAAGHEPDTWQVEATDFSITGAHQIGTRSIRDVANTNAATVEVRYDAFEVVNPQTYTVTRAQNGVVKAHSAGAAVRLADPSVIAL